MEYSPSDLLRIMENFNEDELWELCLHLGISYDDLPAESKVGKIRELFLFMERRDRLDELVRFCLLTRPNVVWLRELGPPVTKGLLVSAEPPMIGHQENGAYDPSGYYNRVKLRLDAALPGEVQQQVSFELAIAIRQPDSPVLQENDLDKTTSGDLQVEWPEDASSAALRVHVSAPECQIYGNDSWSFRLKKGEDSPVYYFQLTPQQVGRIGIVVTVFQEQEWLGGMRLQTKAQEQVAGKVAVQVYSRSFGPSQDIQVMIADFIRAGFSPDELRQLCFALNVEYDDLPGETHTAKTRELVKYMVRRNRFVDLLQECQKQRLFIGWENWANITTGQRARV